MIKWSFLSQPTMCYFVDSGFTCRFHLGFFSPGRFFYLSKKREISTNLCLMINLSLLCFITWFGI